MQKFKMQSTAVIGSLLVSLLLSQVVLICCDYTDPEEDRLANADRVGVIDEVSSGINRGDLTQKATIPGTRSDKLELIQKLKMSRSKVGLKPSEVSEILEQLGAEYYDTEFGRIGDIIELDTGANADKCTILDGQNAIRLWHRFRMTQLGTYIDSLRDKQKQICMEVFKDKFAHLPTSLDGLPQEFWDFMNLLPTDSIFSAVESTAIQLIEDTFMEIQTHYQNDGYSLGFDDVMNTAFSREQYLEQLKSGCMRADELLGDFVWYRKIINVALTPVEKQLFAYFKACEFLKSHDLSYVTNDANLLAEEIQKARNSISKRLDFLKRKRSKLGSARSLQRLD